MSIPYFPLYVIDYEADTTHLTMEEDGCYMRLLRLCWRTPGCSIPNDPAWIARRLRITAEDYERIAAIVISEFFKCEKGRLFSPRLSEEHARISDTFEKRSNAGKKGGRPPKSLKTNKTDESRVKAGPKQPEPEPEPYKERVPVGTASPSDAPPDPAKIMFDSGVTILVAAGKSQGAARGIIGKWRKEHTDAQIIEALGACQRAGAVEPVSWITAALAQSARPTHGRRSRETDQEKTYKILGIAPPKSRSRERLDA
jgi:uncharacterized protein YdaU (DUF1376 family)